MIETHASTTAPGATDAFAPINKAYNTVFRTGRLSIGLFAPIDAYLLDEHPDMSQHLARVSLAENLGFSALWLRDIPFDVPSFGDVGQLYDPFVYLGALAVTTNKIALGIASAILPLRHPAHVAKSVASIDALSGGRMLMGIASGDRPEEYPALAMDFDTRADRFRDSLAYMRAAFSHKPRFEGAQGHLNGHLDMLPKPTAGTVPMLITGGSQQSPDWGANHTDGWITYPRPAPVQAEMIAQYRARLAKADAPNKPVMQSLYLDVLAKPNAPTRPINLGFQCGTDFLRAYLQEIESLGVNHVALNLRFNTADIEETLHLLAQEVLPAFR